MGAGTFHPYYYTNEEETIKSAKKWLDEQLKEFQKGLIEKEGGE